MVCTLAHSQLKVYPKMNVGDKYVYDLETQSTNPMLQFTAKSSIEFKVSEKTENGFIIDMLMSGLENDAKNDKIAAMMSITEGMLKDVKIRVAVDNNGKALRIVNFNEVKEHCVAFADKLLSQIYKEHPELEATTPKAEMMNQAMSTVKEEVMLDGITQTSSNPLCIFGKVITDGMTDTYVNTQKLKMKRTFHLQGNKITANGVSDLTDEEMKEFVIKKVEDNMPEKAEAVKSSIDLLMSPDLMKIDGKEDVVYDLLSSNWPSTIDMTVSLSLMGQKININSHSTLRK